MSGFELVTGTIRVRKQSFTVSEIDGATMKAISKMLGHENERVPIFVVLKCCVTPKFKDEAEVEALPHSIIDKVSDEAWRLTKLGEDDEKKD